MKLGASPISVLIQSQEEPTINSKTNLKTSRELERCIYRQREPEDENMDFASARDRRWRREIQRNVVI